VPSPRASWRAASSCSEIVRELVFALEFRGRAGPVPGLPSQRHARSTAPSQSLRAILTAGGVEASMEPLPGDTAELDSRVERFPDGSFVEDGRISYGRAGTVTFGTIGRGIVGPSPIAGWTYGAAIWNVTGGDGYFIAARGIITSSFEVSPDGDVIDHHVARIYIQDLH
jgi:hypothetical protein